MQSIRQIYESLPGIISVPIEMRRRKVEIIISSLDENETQIIAEKPRAHNSATRAVKSQSATILMLRS